MPSTVQELQTEAGTAVRDVCRQRDISEARFYVWKKRYAYLGVRRQFVLLLLLLAAFSCMKVGTGTNAERHGAGVRYDVAISYASEDRDVAEAIAMRLEAGGYSVFYDTHETDKLWGLDLYAALAEVYSGEARFCLMIVSEAYARKPWPTYERSQAIAAIERKGSGYILPVVRDDTRLADLPPSIVYQDLRRMSIPELITVLARKIGLSQVAPSPIASQDQRAARSILQACNRRALFTRMHAEMNVRAMNDSLAICGGQVQQEAPAFADPALQNVAHQLTAALDQIERDGLEATRRSGIGDARRLNERLDQEKLAAIRLLIELRHRTHLGVILPTELTFESFFTIEDASRPPSIQ